MQPGLEAQVAVEVGQGPVRPEQGLLNRVLGRLVAREALVGVGVEGLVLGADDLFEGALVPGLMGPDEGSCFSL